MEGERPTLRFCLLSFLQQGTIFPFFNSDGNTLVVKVCLKINNRGLQMVSLHIWSIRILMFSWPWTLFGLILTIIFSILPAVMLIVRNHLTVTYLRFVGSLLQCFNKEHWWEKKELKSSAFSSKSVIKQFLWNSGDISLIFFLFKKVFNEKQ